MSKIPTAEEAYNTFPHNSQGYISKGNAIAMAIVLSKLHVKAALEAAANNATITNDYGSGGELFDCIDRESILTAYPENLIK